MSEGSARHCCFVLEPLIAIFGLAQAPPANLTAASTKEFAMNVGQQVVIEGQLSVGKLGYSLITSPPRDVAFWVIPRIPASGRYAYPESWQKHLDRKVRITGKLQFQPAVKLPPSTEPRTTLPDYYFITLQDASIDPISEKPISD